MAGFVRLIHSADGPCALTGKYMADRGTHERKPLASHFATTQWSLIAAVGGKSVNATVRRKALETLCEVYWFPLYAFIRRRSCKQADAEDLTQGFLARLIERNEFADADPARSLANLSPGGPPAFCLKSARPRSQAETRPRIRHLPPPPKSWGCQIIQGADCARNGRRH